MTTQSETIIWHKYPEEIPTKGWKLVDIYPDHDVDVVWFEGDANKTFPTCDWSDVIAWAAMPKGWIE